MILFFLNRFHAQDNNKHVITAKISLELNKNFIRFVITAVQDGVHIILLARTKLVRMKKSQTNEVTGFTIDIFQTFISFPLFFFFLWCGNTFFLLASLFNCCFIRDGEKTLWILKIIFFILPVVSELEFVSGMQDWCYYCVSGTTPGEEMCRRIRMSI